MTTKLERLKAALEAADGAVKVAWDAARDASANHRSVTAARIVAWVAYQEELKKQEGNSDG
jgi:hypothetical protein